MQGSDKGLFGFLDLDRESLAFEVKGGPFESAAVRHSGSGEIANKDHGLPFAFCYRNQTPQVLGSERSPLDRIALRQFDGLGWIGGDESLAADLVEGGSENLAVGLHGSFRAAVAAEPEA